MVDVLRRRLDPKTLEAIVPPTPLDDNVPNIEMIDATVLGLATTILRSYPFGYIQEQNGRLVQNIFPKKKNEQQQISGSSKVQLALHTEAAFHPYLPDHVSLFCIRGDENAATTYAMVDNIVDHLDAKTVEVLTAPLFVTSVDDSFRLNGEPDEEVVLPILRHVEEDGRGWEMVYDEALMRGTTPEAERALKELSATVAVCTREVVLETGDMLVIDNKKAVHGRKPFEARYDGTDRWLLRVLTRKELPPSEYMQGAVINYQFGRS